MTNAAKFIGPGCLVEFMQGGRPLLAWVLEEQSGQLRLWSVNKRESKLPSARILPWPGPVYGATASRQEIQERLERHRQKREELANGLDMLQIWDLAQGEIRQAEAGWFAELVWPEPCADQIAAMGQALLGQKTHFKFSPPFFEVYPAAEVQAREARQKGEEARMELVTVGAEFFRKLYEAARQRKVLPEAERLAVGAGNAVNDALAGLLRERIADPDAHDADGLWKMLIKALPARGPGAGASAPAPGAARLEDEPHLPLMLAVAWGVLPEHYNFWLDRAGYDPSDDWQAPFKAEIEEIAARVERLAQDESGAALPLCAEDLVSVDPESTRDWDDAFRVDPRPGGGYILRVALACPALGWPFESELDRAVLRRASSLYLPEADYHMLPVGLVRGSFSLEAGRLRPALLLRLEFDEAAALLDCAPSLVSLRVKANLTQKQCEDALGDAAAGPDAEISTTPANPAIPANPAAAWAPMLKKALELAEKLKARRLEQGAVITERSEVEIIIRPAEENGGEVQVDLKACAPLPLTMTLVGELMISATYGLTNWARDHAIPLVYRSQDVTLPKEFTGLLQREEDIARVLKALPPSLLGLEPKPHAGLGLPFYSSLTAPIRRYPDLLNEGQILGFLQTGQARFSKEALSALLPLVNSRLDIVGQIQRYRPRYWKLLYFQQQEQLAQRRKSGLKYWEATVTEENNYFTGVMLKVAQLYLRAPRQLCGERVRPGARVQVRLGKINPLRNEIQIMEVLEG